MNAIISACEATFGRIENNLSIFDEYLIEEYLVRDKFIIWTIILFILSIMGVPITRSLGFTLAFASLLAAVPICVLSYYSMGAEPRERLWFSPGCSDMTYFEGSNLFACMLVLGSTCLLVRHVFLEMRCIGQQIGQIVSEKFSSTSSTSHFYWLAFMYLVFWGEPFVFPVLFVSSSQLLYFWFSVERSVYLVFMKGSDLIKFALQIIAAYTQLWIRTSRRNAIEDSKSNIWITYHNNCFHDFSKMALFFKLFLFAVCFFYAVLPVFKYTFKLFTPFFKRKNANKVKIVSAAEKLNVLDDAGHKHQSATLKGTLKDSPSVRGRTTSVSSSKQKPSRSRSAPKKNK